MTGYVVRLAIGSLIKLKKRTILLFSTLPSIYLSLAHFIFQLLHFFLNHLSIPCFFCFFKATFLVFLATFANDGNYLDVYVP